MLRREFLKLLGFGLPALILVKPEIKLENSKPKPIKEFSNPSVWTGTKETTSTITTWTNDDPRIHYVYDHPLNKTTWKEYTITGTWD